MKLFFFALVSLFLLKTTIANCQDDMPPHIKDYITYPALDFHPWVGVMPIKDPAMGYNPDLDYNIALDLYGKMGDSTEILPVLLEVGRTYNLNIANGVPAEKIHISAVIHGGIVKGILKDEEYQKKYGVSNPNLKAIEELEKVGVKFYTCGQSVAFNNIPQENISPLVQVAISAKTTFITLDQMGFSYLNISN